MKSRKQIFLSLFFCVMSGFWVNAFPRTITVLECIDIALQNHPDVFVSIEDNKKSISSYRAAVATRSVMIDGELKTVEYTRKDSTANSAFSIPGQDTDVGLFAGLTIVYNLYDARKDILSESAKVNIDISKINKQRSLDNLAFNVKKTYYGYLQAKKTLELREEIYEKNLKKAGLARLLFENGSRPVLDVTKAELDLAEAQLLLEKARNDERKMKLNLFYSMGLEEDGAADITPIDRNELPELKFTIDELYKLADIYNPLIRRTKLEKRIARLKVSQEQANHFPKVDLLLGLGYENQKLTGGDNFTDNFKGDNWNPAFHGAIKASVPVYSGGRTSALVDSAVSDYNILSLKEKEILTGTKNAIRDSVRSLDEIQRQIELSRLIQDNAERHQVLAQRSYEHGNGSLMELQDAELSVIKARLGHMEARYAYLLTMAALANTIGIGEEAICIDRAETR